jgi:hypothetical protein
LLLEKYQGIRPAHGYPACPDHSEKDTLFNLLNVTKNAGITLTETNLETGRLAFRKQLDDKGQKIMVEPKVILVPIDLGKTANIIVSSNLRSGVADNDVNVYQGKFQIVEWPFLTSTTAWWLLGNKGDHLVNWLWRVQAQFKQDNSFDSDAALWKVRERFAYGWSDWHSVWGSKGDGGAYAS